ncbi:hypothetical protein [Halorussus salinus]|nr:hypothetical protein [Halorussus salinus]
MRHCERRETDPPRGDGGRNAHRPATGEHRPATDEYRPATDGSERGGR